ncbi:MAG TPA: VOC family protein, partial [Inquilinus sp.]
MTTAPRIDGLLETSLYVADLDRAADFYERVLGLRAMLRSPRLVALDAGRQGVLLLFLAGATSEDVVDSSGTIPGHEGTGRL